MIACENKFFEALNCKSLQVPLHASWQILETPREEEIPQKEKAAALRKRFLATASISSHFSPYLPDYNSDLFMLWLYVKLIF